MLDVKANLREWIADILKRLVAWIHRRTIGFYYGPAKKAHLCFC